MALFAAAIAIASAEFSRRQANAAKRQANAAEDQAEAAEKQADSAKKQAVAAEDQANTAREQAEMAKQQAAAAWEQVAEAKRANDEMAAERAERRALDAVRWIASIDGNLSRIIVRNNGNEAAYNVQVSRYGADEDWGHGPPPDVVVVDEVRAGDHAIFPVRNRAFRLPGQIYVLWEGASHPRAVVVEIEKIF